jgi:hypothetical protein
MDMAITGQRHAFLGRYKVCSAALYIAFPKTAGGIVLNLQLSDLPSCRGHGLFCICLLAKEVMDLRS